MTMMDHHISLLYEALLVNNDPLINVVRRDNFVLVRVVGNDYCREVWSLLLKPADTPEDDPAYVEFKEWAKYEYPGSCCYCDPWHDDDYYWDEVEDYYDTTSEEEEREFLRQQWRERKTRNWKKKGKHGKWKWKW